MPYLRSLLSISFIILIILFFSSSCKKTVTVTNTIKDTVLVKAVDTTFQMNAKSWNCYSYQTNTLIDSGATRYFTTAEGVKFMGQGYRLGARLQIKSELGFFNKVVYFKWKAYGAGQFAYLAVQIKYDPLSNDGTPAVQGVDLGTFSVANTFGGSVLIQDNVWYYTRLVPVSGSDTYQVITATGNYNNMGGTTISTTNAQVYTKAGYIALRVSDNYASTAAYAILGECKIAPN